MFDKMIEINNRQGHKNTYDEELNFSEKEDQDFDFLE
jgi:hypothetical protein